MTNTGKTKARNSEDATDDTQSDIQHNRIPPSCELPDGVVLRPYQERVIQEILEANGGIVRGTTGCGKTLIAFSSARRTGYRRILVLVPRLSALLTWKNVINLHGLEATIIEKWPSKKRQHYWQETSKLQNYDRIVVMLYQTFLRDVGFMRAQKNACQFSFIICDEAHAFKDYRTETFKALKPFARGKSVVTLSATFESHGPHNLWPQLNLIRPHAFSSYWDFVKEFCYIEEDGYSKMGKITGVRKDNLARLREKIKPYLFKISAKEIEGFVPPVVRSALPIELSTPIRKAYERMVKHSVIEGSDGLVIAANQLAKRTHLRMLLACPALYQETLGPGDAIKEVLAHATSEFEVPHVMLFSEFKEPFKWWRNYILSKNKRAKVFMLYGGISVTEQQSIIAEFARHKYRVPSWLFCTSAVAESFDVLSAENGYVIGVPQSQTMNYQAEGRMRRGQKSHVNMWYAHHPNTVDEDIMALLSEKKFNTSIVSGGDN